ncbi:hypothetical protein R84981_002043 [Carnimonas sp. R-84981]|uniref:DUF1161 domain-containing protein n=1 Tax=Carnimonas bestiolae TaxID=3402172 RepID=UPI003EDC9380
MKKCLAVALLSSAAVISTQAYASCDSLINRLSQKIESNGVPAGSYSIEAVPNAEAQQAGGKVIGSCEGQTRKVVYDRNGGGHSSSSSSQASGSDHSPSDDQAAPVSGSKPGSFKGGVQRPGSVSGSSETPVSGEAPNEAEQSAHSD